MTYSPTVFEQIYPDPVQGLSYNWPYEWFGSDDFFVDYLDADGRLVTSMTYPTGLNMNNVGRSATGNVFVPLAAVGSTVTQMRARAYTRPVQSYIPPAGLTPLNAQLDRIASAAGSGQDLAVRLDVRLVEVEAAIQTALQFDASLTAIETKNAEQDATLTALAAADTQLAADIAAANASVANVITTITQLTQEASVNRMINLRAQAPQGVNTDNINDPPMDLEVQGAIDAAAANDLVLHVPAENFFNITTPKTFPAGTRMTGGGAFRMAAGATLTIGDGCVIDHLKIIVTLSNNTEQFVTIGANCQIGTIEIIGEAGSNQGVGTMTAVAITGAKTRVGTIHVAGGNIWYGVGLTGGDIEVGRITSAGLRQTLRLTGGARYRVGAVDHATTPGTFSVGGEVSEDAAVLIDGATRSSIDHISASGAVTEVVRIEGATQDLTIGDIEALAPHSSVLSLVPDKGASERVSGLHIGSVTGRDVGDRDTPSDASGLLGDLVRLAQCDDVVIGSIVNGLQSRAGSARSFLRVYDASRVRIGGLSGVGSADDQIFIGTARVPALPGDSLADTNSIHIGPSFIDLATQDQGGVINLPLDGFATVRGGIYIEDLTYDGVPPGTAVTYGSLNEPVGFVRMAVTAPDDPTISDSITLSGGPPVRVTLTKYT